MEKSCETCWHYKICPRPKNTSIHPRCWKNTKHDPPKVSPSIPIQSVQKMLKEEMESVMNDKG